jgi:hypothetical protein
MYQVDHLLKSGRPPGQGPRGREVKPLSIQTSGVLCRIAPIDTNRPYWFSDSPRRKYQRHAVCRARAFKLKGKEIQCLSSTQITSATITYSSRARYLPAYRKDIPARKLYVRNSRPTSSLPHSAAYPCPYSRTASDPAVHLSAL